MEGANFLVVKDGKEDGMFWLGGGDRLGDGGWEWGGAQAGQGALGTFCPFALSSIYPCHSAHTHAPHSMPFHPADTPMTVVEEAFNALTARDDVGIVLINQHVRIRETRDGRMGHGECCRTWVVTDDPTHPPLHAHNQTDCQRHPPRDQELHQDHPHRARDPFQGPPVRTQSLFPPRLSINQPISPSFSHQPYNIGMTPRPTPSCSE